MEVDKEIYGFFKDTGNNKWYFYNRKLIGASKRNAEKFIVLVHTQRYLIDYFLCYDSKSYLNCQENLLYLGNILENIKHYE